MKPLSFAPLLFLCTVAAKINIAAPVNAVSGGPYTVTWTHDASDPSEFTLMIRLVSHSWATGQFWEFTQTKDNKLDVVFLNEYPYQIIPDGIFRLQARNQSNVDQVYSDSETFQFLPPGSSPPPPPSPSVSLSAVPSSSSAPASVSSSLSSASGGTSRSVTPSSSAAVPGSSIVRSSSANNNATESSQGASATPSPATGGNDAEDGGAKALMGQTAGASAVALIAAAFLVV